MTIKEMQDNMIRKFGFEHAATIYFFEECEHLSDNIDLIEVIYWFAINWKNINEDEEI